MDIQEVITRSAAPATIINSPSVHMRLRTRVRPRRRWRSSSLTRACGVREKRQPPTATVSPSRTRAAASSTLVSFSPADFAFASNRRRAATKSGGPYVRTSQVAW